MLARDRALSTLYLILGDTAGQATSGFGDFGIRRVQGFPDSWNGVTFSDVNWDIRAY